ncbi:MAG: ATP phosphoribosyltransferase regulatory subunit, partial [Firmicutes bacterium]|nr:ATP phosphoribosyltransferase regulatory subunit [Bacillota bacterium]
KSIIKGLDSQLCETMRELVFNKNFPALDSFADKISADTLDKLKKLPTMFGKEEVLKKAKDTFLDSESKDALDYLQNLYNKLQELKLDKYVSFDLGIVNDYDYYTGIVFKGYINKKGDAVLSGGRYDTLYKSFGLDYPAIGFAFNVDELLGV